MTTYSSAAGAEQWTTPRRALPHAKQRKNAVDQADGLGAKTLSFLSRLVKALTAIFSVGSLIYVGWYYRDLGWITADHGVGYALGIASATCMVTLLIYPLRKRIRALRFIGPASRWFRVHMTLGISAPILALYHANFTVGSLNSQIALYCALSVASSGLVGRFLYRKAHQDLSGQKAGILQIRKSMDTQQLAGENVLFFLRLVKQRLYRFDRNVMQAGASLPRSLLQLLTLSWRCRRETRVLLRFTIQQLDRHAQRSLLIRSQRVRLEQALILYLRRHMRDVRRLAQAHAYERLFALWHLVHLPFFALLFVSVIVHIFAVHLY